MLDNKNPMVASSAILGICLVLVAIIVANAFYQVKSLSNVISVTGSAEKIVVSDLAKWSTNFSRSVTPEMLKEGTGQMQQDAKLVLEYFKQNGLKDNEITMSPMTMSAVCESQNNIMYDRNGNQTCASGRISSYQLQQNVILESDDVQKLNDLSKVAVDQLVSKGVIFASQNFEYYYKKLADLRVDLLAEATKNAQLRAEKISQSTGSRIGKLQNASMGVFQVSAKNSVEVSDYGMYDTASMEKKITAVVRASFVLK